MSEVSQGPGWWLASDGRWYPPEQAPGYLPRSVSADATALPLQGESASPPMAAGPDPAPGWESYPTNFAQPPIGPGVPTAGGPQAEPAGPPPPYGPGVAAPPAYGYPPQQPPPYYPYAPNGYYPDGRVAYPVGPMVRPNQTNPLAIASLVCGCVGIIPFLGILGVILGFVFGLIAKSQIKRSGGVQEGNGLATAGIIISAVITALWIILWIVVATHTNNGVCTDGNC